MLCNFLISNNFQIVKYRYNHRGFIFINYKFPEKILLAQKIDIPLAKVIKEDIDQEQVSFQHIPGEPSFLLYPVGHLG